MASQMSKEEELWQAATVGDMEAVKRLTGDPDVDVNWQDPKNHRTPLYRACGHGKLEIVKHLLAHPKIDVNRAEHEGATPFLHVCSKGDIEAVVTMLDDPRVAVTQPWKNNATPFFQACQNGHTVVVSLLLADGRIDPCTPSNDGATPFLVSCEFGRAEVVRLLLGDPRIDPVRPDCEDATPFFCACAESYPSVVRLLMDDPRTDPNKPRNDESTPLWYASQNGSLDMIHLLLASDTVINTRTKSTWNNKTAAEHARWAAVQPEWKGYTDDDPERRRRDCPIIAALIDEYEMDPTPVRRRLRQLPRIRGHFIGQAFALVVFYSDDFVRLKPGEHEEISRFLRLCKLLPMDLQMVLCNRLFGSGRNVVTSIDSEPGFRWLARRFTQSLVQ